MKTYVFLMTSVMFTMGTVVLGWASSYGHDREGPMHHISRNNIRLASTRNSDTAFSGTVQHVDSSNKIIEVRDTYGDVHAILVDPGIQIKRSGSIVQLSEVRDGDVVVIRTTSSSL